jgi:hypothetical protein
MADPDKLKLDAQACLGEAKSAGTLVECVSAHFPDVDVYRENEDLIVKGGGKYLIVRRAGPDRFRVSENIAVPSTNLVDQGGGMERTLDELIADIATLAT